jgi:hypothetical protein
LKGVINVKIYFVNSQALEEHHEPEQHFFVTDSAEFDAFPTEVIEDTEEPMSYPLPPIMIEDDALMVEEEDACCVDNGFDGLEIEADHLVEGYNDEIVEEIDVAVPSVPASTSAPSKQSKVQKSGIFYKDGQDLDSCFVANSARRVSAFP